MAGSLWIEVVAGPDRGRRLHLTEAERLVGTDPDCDLVLSDPALAPRHLGLRREAGGVRVRALEAGEARFAGARLGEAVLGPGAILAAGATELRVGAFAERTPGLQPSSADRFGALLGRSLAMRRVYALLERLALTDVAVHLEGESGTGKEVCAEALHLAGPRATKPFVLCDLAGVSRPLIESELFGHVRGAFTGADRDREGAFAQAHGGTIFIDEIGELELEMQPRLLRALEQRRIKPVGAAAYREVDVRLVVATNRDLRSEVKAGRFREDLYHRLAVVTVRLPPLRERREDLPLLVAAFLASRPGDPIEVPPETHALLAEHDWPGNVRELRNVIDRGISLMDADRVLWPSLLGLHPDADAAFEPLGSAWGAHPDGSPSGFREAKERVVSAWEREFLTQLLERAGGNVSQAARDGGIDRVYLHRLLKKHALGGTPSH